MILPLSNVQQLNYSSKTSKQHSVLLHFDKSQSPCTAYKFFNCIWVSHYSNCLTSSDVKYLYTEHKYLKSPSWLPFVKGGESRFSSVSIIFSGSAAVIYITYIYTYSYIYMYMFDFLSNTICHWTLSFDPSLLFLFPTLSSHFSPNHSLKFRHCQPLQFKAGSSIQFV